MSDETTDPWLVRETKILTDFTRLFPPRPSGCLAGEEALNSPHSVEEDEDEDEHDKDEEGPSKDGSEAEMKARRRRASLIDILVAAFEHDQRLTLRFLRARDRSSAAITPSATPSLPDTSKRIKDVASEKSGPETRPTSEIAKTQAETVARLSQGLSANGRAGSERSLRPAHSSQHVSMAERRFIVDSLLPLAGESAVSLVSL